MQIKPPSDEELARRGLAPDGTPLKPKAAPKKKAPAKKKPTAMSGASKPKLTVNED